MYGTILLCAALSLGQSPVPSPGPPAAPDFASFALSAFAGGDDKAEAPEVNRPTAPKESGSIRPPELVTGGDVALGSATEQFSVAPPVPPALATESSPTIPTSVFDVPGSAPAAWWTAPVPGGLAGAASVESAPARPTRRAMPSPFDSPPFPGSEYQGYPLIGVPPDTYKWPLMQYLQGTWYGDLLDTSRIRMWGWITGEANWANAVRSNTPTSYWIRPNNVDVDQAIIRFSRELDSVQTDHIDWGFRITQGYGIDYRYFTAGGWFSDQLLKHNLLYGYDMTEVYGDLYIPWVAQGMILRVGRWIACPDIETQFSVDNYMGSHSLLFTFDTYTQTGIMATFMLSKQWTFQAAIHSGTDMAPWYPGAIPTGAFGLRWVSKSNNDAMYTWLNAINDAKFRRFDVDGQPAGHDNFNYLVSTWEHRFSREFITKTEGYIMWQRDAVVGGTPSIGPLEPWGGGGGIGADIPGTTLTFGFVNFTVHQLDAKSYFTIRNEWWKDTDGERSGFPSTYTSNAIGYSRYLTPNILWRPEIGYYRSWTVPAFDLGTRKNLLMCAFDFTIRF
jgi:hypothetical protein